MSVPIGNPQLEAAIRRVTWGPSWFQLKRFVQGESDEVKAELLARVIGGELAAELATGVIEEPERLRFELPDEEDEAEAS